MVKDNRQGGAYINDLIRAWVPISAMISFEDYSRNPQDYEKLRQIVLARPICRAPVSFASRLKVVLKRRFSKLLFRFL